MCGALLGTSAEKESIFPSGDQAMASGESSRSVMRAVCPVSIQRT
jgi:hypothetical protein